MLTHLTVRNFKRFGEAEIELGDTVIFVGPNNSGKTSALQALALWEIGLQKWNERYRGRTAPSKRPGVTINRRDLVAVPVPDAKQLWRKLHVRDVSRDENGQNTQNVRIEIIVRGITEGREWECGLEFDYANDESFYCRPLRTAEGNDPKRMPVPEEAASVKLAFLPPMSGLAANETRLDTGAVNVRIGEGRTAEILRNLCHQVHEGPPTEWASLTNHIADLFGVLLGEPLYIRERGEIVMDYEEDGIRLDLSCAGRGLQQTLLLLAYMYSRPDAVLLLDEPHAHLEILRQRQIYQLLTDIGRDKGIQIIAASHSEVVLNEAASRDIVIAFVGRTPHRLNDRGSQVLKALRDIPFDQYLLAEQTGWVLYLEGPTDLAILQSFAERLGHPAAEALRRPFVEYVGEVAKKVPPHFYALREAVPHMRGMAVFDRLDRPLTHDLGATCHMWRRREIENYLCTPATLDAFARAEVAKDSPGPLFAAAQELERSRAMQEAIGEFELARKTTGEASPWSVDTKASEEFLVPLFDNYFAKLDLPNLMGKRALHQLARYVPVTEIDPEVREALDAIAQVAASATPAEDAE